VQEQFEKEAMANTQNSLAPCIQKSFYANQQKYDVGLVAVKRGRSWRARSFWSKSCLALAKKRQLTSKLFFSGDLLRNTSNNDHRTW